MGNLFRCPINHEEREYILKSEGIVQEGYIHRKIEWYNSGEGSVTPSSASVTRYGTAVSNYIFDATNWNKIHIKRAIAYGSGEYYRGVVGVCSYTNSAGDIDYNTKVKGDLILQTEKDFVLDISKLSGEYLFYIMADCSSEYATNVAKAIVRGDVYLTK